jgi:hypothetical protein
VIDILATKVVLLLILRILLLIVILFQNNQRKSGFGASDELSSEEDGKEKLPTGVAGTIPASVLRKRRLHSFSNPSSPQVNLKRQ